MNRIIKSIVPMAMAAVIMGCGSDNDDVRDIVVPEPPVPELGTSYVRVIHGSADAPLVNIKAGDDIIEGLGGVDYGVGSGFLELPEGTYPLSVEGILPDDSTIPVLDLGDVALSPDVEYTVIAHGYVMEDDDTSNDLAAAVITNDKTDVGEGNIRVQVLHAAPNAPTVDLHVTGATDELTTALATLAYGDATDQVEVPAGVYRVRLVIPAGMAGEGTVAYDVVLPDLAAGADLFVAAVPNTEVMTSPVKLLVNDGMGTSTIYDDRTTAQVRVIHAAADVPNVDIFVDDTKVDSLSNAPFGGVTGYAALPEGTYTVDARLTSDNSVTGITDDLMVMNNNKYTVNAVGTLDAMDSADLEYYVLTDNVRAVATESKVRITHAHPSVGNVDIYVTADGMIDDVEPAFSDVPFKATTDFVTLSPGEYNVKVTATGTKTVAIDTGMLDLMGGKVYSATAVDAPMATPANLILSDDFIE
ncbi:DUF4397 domain-containing protein [Thalassotalea sp. LPB0316]|uniref:DUF4397 domain-containing protein n=1 Tax=Thalassotalea sp. LPB0316 TaxID=2769490 RepID=UPI001868C04D|nr:DUF4397 domain-containing protein [Thalassotalea sp. LPB0316]QOL25826.1 DUF4397 domain-containing protein [Thalassotalea sp. LPB0316]